MGIFGGSKPSIITKTLWDEKKTAVANPLSEFLSQQIGKGIPRYTEATGNKLTYDFDDREMSPYRDFLALDAGEWYDKAVANPAMKKYKEDVLPEIREGYAGSLRGSGRFRAEEAGLNQFSESLAQGRYIAEKEIPQAQFKMASTYKGMKDKDYAMRYNTWLSELPHYNPALNTAIQFLQKSTSTGKTVLSALDPGQKGAMGDMGQLGMIAGALLAAPTGGMSLAMGGLYGGLAGYGAGALMDYT